MEWPQERSKRLREPAQISANQVGPTRKCYLQLHPWISTTSKVLTNALCALALWGGLPACWPRKTSRKLRSEPLGASESLLRSHRGLGTGPRALREASRRLKERSGRPKDGFKSAPGGPRTTPRALREASRRPRERSGRLKTAQERSARLEDGSKSSPGGLKTP